MIALKLEVLRGGGGAHEQRCVVDHCPKIEVVDLDHHLSRFHLGEVEDVVDDREQRLGGGVDGGRVLALLGIELRVEQQRCHPDDAVHRRADLVAHVGEELRLQSRRFLGLIRRRSEITVDALAFGDVVERDHRTGDDLVLDDREHRVLRCECRAVAPPHLLRGRPHTAAAAQDVEDRARLPSRTASRHRACDGMRMHRLSQHVCSINPSAVCGRRIHEGAADPRGQFRRSLHPPISRSSRRLLARRSALLLGGAD